ncbi:MAG: hypothetical protein K0U68_03000 [Gammaproteobacteria bacterium]|nr:hypothetical protein [Gammaproteobacteria bacterium]
MVDHEHRMDVNQLAVLNGFFMIRGLMLMIFGGVLAALSAINPGVGILFGHNSWLPLAALVILASALVGLFDILISNSKEASLVHVSLATMDLILSIMILAELDDDASKLALLLAFYLMSRSLFRVFSGFLVRFPHSQSIIITGFIGFILGAVVWIKSAVITIPILSVMLCLELALRGWSLFRFGRWIRTNRINQMQSDMTSDNL